MSTLGISDTLVRMNLQCEEGLSENNLALSQTLQMFCTEAFKSSMLIGAPIANLCGSLFGFQAFSLGSKLFGASSFATRAFSFGAKVIAEGTMFHIAPELLETRSLQTANLFRGSASSTLMVAFSQAAGKFGGGFLVQQMFQDLAVLGSQDLSAYLGWSEVQTGGIYNRLVYAQISSCQMQVGAGVVHLTCHEITMMNAKVSLAESLNRTPTRADTTRGWLHSIRTTLQGAFALRSANEMPIDAALNQMEQEIPLNKSMNLLMMTSAEGKTETSLTAKIRGRLPEIKREATQQGRKLAMQSIAFALDFARRVDLARFTPPDPTFNRLHYEQTPPTLRTTLEGEMLAQDPALIQKAALYRSKVEEELKRTPQTAVAYRDFEERRSFFREELQQRLDPILQEFAPLLDRLDLHVTEVLSPAAESYHQQVKKLFGEGENSATAEFLLNLCLAREIRQPKFRESYTDEALRIVGYEPNSIEWTIRQCHVFRPGMIEAVLDANAELAEAVGVEKLRAAARHFDETYAYRGTAEKLAEELLALDQQATKNEEMIRDLTQKISEAEKLIFERNQALQNAFREFFSHRSTALLWLAENALHASTRKLLFRNENEILQEILKTCFPTAEIDFAIRAKKFLNASLRCKTIGEEMAAGRSGVLDTLAALAGTRDYHELQIARGEAEAAMNELLLHHQNWLIKPAMEWMQRKHAALFTNKAKERSFEGLMEARVVLSKAISRWTEIANSGFSPSLTDLMKTFWEYHDRQMGELRSDGIKLGAERYREILETRIKSVVGEEIYEREIAPEWKALESTLQKQLEEYRKAVPVLIAGRGKPRDFNRRIEAPARTVTEQFHDFITQTAAKYHIPIGNLSHFLPMFELYAEARDQADWRKLLPYAIPALQGMLRFTAGRGHHYPVEYSRHEAIRFNTQAVQHLAPQTFFTHPKIEPLLDYQEGAVVVGNHTNHFELLPASVTFQALRPHNHRTIMADIMAKFDLKLPGVTDILKAVCNLVPNTPSGIRAAEALASEVAATGSPVRQQENPSAALIYPQRTMGLATVDLYGNTHFPPTHEILPTTEAGFDIAEGVSALTGRPGLIVSMQTPGTVRNRPNQHVLFGFNQYPSSAVLRVFPFSAFPQEISNRTRLHNRANNILRTLWLIDGHDPRYDEGFANFSSHRSQSVKEAVHQWQQRSGQIFTGIAELLLGYDPFNFG